MQGLIRGAKVLVRVRAHNDRPPHGLCAWANLFADKGSDVAVDVDVVWRHDDAMPKSQENLKLLLRIREACYRCGYHKDCGSPVT